MYFGSTKPDAFQAVANYTVSTITKMLPVLIRYPTHPFATTTIYDLSTNP